MVYATGILEDYKGAESYRLVTFTIKHHGTKSYPFGHVGEKKATCHLMITVVGTCLWILCLLQCTFHHYFSTLLFIEGPMT